MSDTTVTLAAGAAAPGSVPRFYLTRGASRRQRHPARVLDLPDERLPASSRACSPRYGVLGRNYAGGPTGAEIFELPVVARQHLAAAALVDHLRLRHDRDAAQRRQGATLAWLAITGLLGAGFVGIELHEFAHLIHEGAGPQRSAFLSSFFTLVGTHGLHVTLRHRLAGHADGAGRPARPERRQPAAPDVPVACSGTSSTSSGSASSRSST